jgi:ABC-type lipoprotein release transport system permease subunit
MHLLIAGSAFSLVTIVAAIYPAWKGAGIDPSTALVAI